MSSPNANGADKQIKMKRIAHATTDLVLLCWEKEPIFSPEIFFLTRDEVSSCGNGVSDAGSYRTRSQCKVALDGTVSHAQLGRGSPFLFQWS